MYILTLKGKKQEGAYAVETSDGSKVLQMFVDSDDAERYIGLLEADGFPELEAIEIEESDAVAACENFGYNYCIIAPDDFVIPPDTINYDFI
jgi:hypothetical protein